MEINKEWNFTEGQYYTIGDKEYNVHDCIRLSSDLPVREMNLEDIYLGYSALCGNTFKSFLQHVKMIDEADLSFPVLMNEEGIIIDGRHRLAKAILAGEKTIKFKRFTTDPSAGYKIINKS